MPLTKPECLDCGYNLRGTRFGEMCPECGGVERELLFDGSSRVLDVTLILSGLVLGLSFGVMVIAFTHTTFMPSFQTKWVLEATFALRSAVIPALYLSAAVSGVMGYAVLIISNLNHNLNRIRVIQVWSCLGMSVISVVVAIVWMM